MSDIRGTFATGFGVAGVGDQVSESVLVQSSTTSMKLSTSGLTASNQIKTQKKADSNAAAWTDVATYNSDQSLLAVTVVPGEVWRIVTVLMAQLTTVRYKLSQES